MPIYEYYCHACGHEEEILQKISDQPLKVCTQCGKTTFERLISKPAGFDLKGDGWYVTDFKNNTNNSTAETTKAEAKTALEKSSTHSTKE